MTITAFSKKIRTADGYYLIELSYEHITAETCILYVIQAFSTDDTVYRTENKNSYSTLSKAKSRYTYMIRKLSKAAE